MSQALEIYKNHQFHKTWQSFKDEFHKGYIPEQINDPVRLENYDIINKKIEFIDNWLSLIDPELGMTNTHLNTVNSFINEAKRYIAYEQTYASKNDTRNAISNLNSCILEVSKCIDTIIKLPIAIPKVTSNSITRMLNNYRDTIQQALTEINLEKTKNDASDIKNYKQKLIDNENSISKTIDNEYKKINHFYNELLADEQNKISIKQQVVNGKNEILGHIKQIKEQHSEFNTKLDEFKNYYVQIFGSYDDETKTRTGGLRQEIENKIQELDSIRKRHNDEYDEIRKEVESHRDILVATGLAEAYSEERKKYSKPVKYWDTRFRFSVWFLFILVSVMTGMSFLNDPNTFYSTNNAVSSLLRTIPITLPFIWFAIYANKRRGEYHRLEQEYTHKEILAKSYLNYKEQIEKLQTNDPELLSKLMGSTIDSIAYNPSPTLDKKHGDGTLLSEISKSVKDIAKGLGNLNKK